jgi:hypothetical protein
LRQKITERNAVNKQLLDRQFFLLSALLFPPAEPEDTDGKHKSTQIYTR